MDELIPPRGVEMLTQPLMTADGFLNPAAMNELAAAFKRSIAPHGRLADDPEWTVKRWTGLKDITGALAKWAIRQSPHGLPDNLEGVVKYLQACLRLTVPWGDSGLAKLSLCDVSFLLYGILCDQGFAPFDAWNSPKREPTPAERMLPHSKRPPDTEFIGLDALLLNTCVEIRDERRADDASDKRIAEAIAEPE